MTTLGQACGDLIEVFTELEDTLPESVYRDLEPVITKVRESAERAIVIEKQFELLHRLTVQLATNHRVRLRERAIAAIETGDLDGMEVDVVDIAPEPRIRRVVPVRDGRGFDAPIEGLMRDAPVPVGRAPLNFNQFQGIINPHRDNHE